MTKKALSKNDYIDFLLLTREQLGKIAIEKFEEKFEFQGNEKRSDFEIKIFTLWLITITIPVKDKEIKDLLHKKFVLKYWGKEADKLQQTIFQEIDQRYQNYYKAFEIWSKNHRSGSVIGGVIEENIINKNSDFSLDKYLPNTGLISGMIANAIFVTLLNTSYEVLSSVGLKK